MNIKQWIVELWQMLCYDYTHIDLHSNRTRLALKTAIATTLALYIAWSLDIVNPQWAAISAIIIIQASSGATIFKGIQRIIGTIIGVSWGILLIAWFGDETPLFLFMVFLTIAYCYYHGRRTPNIYAWTLGPATFLLVVFSLPISAPSDITNIAYYRTFEIIIGTVCAIIVNILIYPSHAIVDLRKNTQAMWKALAELYEKCLQNYCEGKADPSFTQGVQNLKILIEQHATMRRFATQESLFNIKTSAKIQAQEKLAEACIELLLELHFGCQTPHKALADLFAKELENIKIAATNAFIELDHFSQSNVDASFQKAILAWENSIDALFNRYTELRPTGIFLNYEPIPFRNWQQFMMGLRNCAQILKNFQIDCRGKKRKASLSHRLEQLFSFDRFYATYALKGAAATIILPIIGLAMNLSGFAMLGVILVILFQLDTSLRLSNNQRMSFDKIVGFMLGTLAALIVLALNFTNVYFYLLAFAIVLFFTAYLQHGGKLAYTGVWMSIILAIGTATGTGPITSWVASLELLIAASLGLIAVVVIYTWLLPTNYRSLLEHYQTQLNYYHRQILLELHNRFSHQNQTHLVSRVILQTELDEFKKNIKAFASADFNNNFDNTTLQNLSAAWQRCYNTLFNIMLTQQSFCTPEELQKDLPGAQYAAEILIPKQSPLLLAAANEKINLWLAQYRQRAAEGHFLDVGPLLANVSLFHLLQNYIEQLQLINELNAKLQA